MSDAYKNRYWAYKKNYWFYLLKRNAAFESGVCMTGYGKTERTHLSMGCVKDDDPINWDSEAMEQAKP